MSFSGKNWTSRYTSSSAFPFLFSSDRNSPSNSSSSGRSSQEISSYNRHRNSNSLSNSTPSSKSSSYSSLKSHQPKSPYSPRNSSSSSSSSGYSYSSGSGYVMGHYGTSPAKAGSGRDTSDYRNNRSSKSNSGSLPSQYSRLISQRSYSGYDRKPTRPSSLYEARAMRSFDSEYSQTPAGHHAVVHQLTIRPNVEESNKSKMSSTTNVDRRSSISSLNHLNTPKPPQRNESPKERKGIFNLRKRLSASLSSLVSSLGSSLSYSMQDLSTSSVDLNVAPSPSPSLARLHHASDDDSDDDAEYSDSVGSGSGPSSDLEPTQDSSKSENGVTSINYKKLYEEVLKENQLLKGRVLKTEEDMADLKLKLERVSLTPRITSEDLDRREKRALERKLSEMEEELKESRHLRTENQKLRDENGALIRVISKLSK